MARAIEGHRTAAEVIGPVVPGMSVFAVTRGQISMIDVIAHLVSEAGPCNVSVWTWCVADYEVEAFESLLANRRITGATLIIDFAGERRNVELTDRWRARFGDESVRVVKNHAKLATVSNDRVRLLARGSMNLNENPRFEQFDVSEGDAAFDLVREIELEIPVSRRMAPHHAAVAATGLASAWSADALKPFAGVRQWKP